MRQIELESGVAKLSDAEGHDDTGGTIVQTAFWISSL